MKKIILLLFLFIFGCDKIPTGVVDVQQTDFQTVAVKSPESVIYTKSDSSFVTSIKFNSTADINQVWVDLFNSDNSQLNSSPIYLYDDGNLASNGDSTKGDMVFSAKVPMSSNYSNGSYTLKYTVLDKDNTERSVAAHNFNYKAVLIDTPPVISNLVAPDTLTITSDAASPTNFILTLNVSDKDGQNDIKEVYFKLFKPDGSQTSTPKNLMYDDGDFSHHGDKTAGDGVYSYGGQLPAGTPKGNWKFVFYAADKSDSLSNVITHYIYIK
ncbi:MAG: hypothetical protein Q8858_11490 [Bacteroidota bacterium]|nr:hypothetical protein [Bacteroidota bacterium]